MEHRFQMSLLRLKATEGTIFRWRIPLLHWMVEAAGIEPASESSSTTASTCVVYLLDLTRRPPVDGVAGAPAQ